MTTENRTLFENRRTLIPRSVFIVLLGTGATYEVLTTSNFSTLVVIAITTLVAVIASSLAIVATRKR